MSAQNATTPSDIAAIMPQLLAGAEGLQMTRFATAAAGAIYVYSILVSFDEEVEYFWSTLRPTFPNLLYIINRYVCLGFFLNIVYDMSGLHGDFSQAYCTKCTGVIGLTLAHLSWTGIMTIRVAALWRSHPRLVYSLWALWAGIMVVIGLFTYLSYKSVIATMTYNKYMRICATDHNPKVMVASPLPPTLYELLLTVLTIIKTYKFIAATNATSPPILHVLARDGVIYFVLSSVVSVSNMLSWHLLPPEFSGFLLYIYWALLSTCTSYLTLNLRRAYYHGRANETEQLSSQGLDPTITFARMPGNPPNSRVVGAEVGHGQEYDQGGDGDGDASTIGGSDQDIRYPRPPRERFTSTSSVWVVHDSPSRTHRTEEPTSAGTGRSSTTTTTGRSGLASTSQGPSGSGNPTGLKAACAFIMGDGEFFRDPSLRRSPSGASSDEENAGASTSAKKKDGSLHSKREKEKDLEKSGAKEDGWEVVDVIPLTKLIHSRSR